MLLFNGGIYLQSNIYFDNSATTKPCDSTITAVNNALSNVWGNPSSLHRLGIESECIINDTRRSVAELLSCKSEQIFFTGSGTEANNLAIIGTANSMKRRGNKIITTTIEHPSVLNTCHFLENEGFNVVYVKPHTDGLIHAEDILNNIDDQTILVSVMLVNNETGCILPVSEIANNIHQQGLKPLIHTDCVQAFGKIPLDIEDLGVDLLSASGHKIHGPKGIGILYKSPKVNLKPIIFGGNQEKGLRSGTEPVPLIAGLNGAISELNITENFKHISDLYQYAISKLQNIDDVTINSPKNNYLPYIVNFSVIGYRSETLLHFLEEQNIFVSSGSACSKGKGSYVLNEVGFSKDRIDSALRISFSRYNTKDEINEFYLAIKNAQNNLRKKHK